TTKSMLKMASFAARSSCPRADWPGPALYKMLSFPLLPRSSVPVPNLLSCPALTNLSPILKLAILLTI
ncbi:uncharacterized protein BJX67DRAFT_350632, partial [Aspergillus lucknowensis]